MRISMQGQAAGSRPLSYSNELSHAIAKIRLRGRVVDVGFEDFLESYVRRLTLDLKIDDRDGDLFSFLVSGKPELIDMLLTVCWLGPHQALVDDIQADFLVSETE